MFKINSTYKAKDVEEGLDKIFYRPLGYILAIGAKGLGLTPNAVTFLSMIVGVIAGRLLYYNYFNFDIAAILLLMLSEVLDSADGQLARMKQKYSKVGKILDGLATNFTFISIYIHLCLRMINNGYTDAIFLIALICGMSHSIQSAVADFYRNIYLMVVHGKGEYESFETLSEKYSVLSWSKNFLQKLAHRLYLNYTKEQQSLTRSGIELYNNFNSKYPNGNSPEWLKNDYRKIMHPMLKYYNILTTNTRLVALFIALLANNIMFFFIVEFGVLNVILALTLAHQNKLNHYLNEKLISAEV